mgnify:CR=1 FL=1
MILNSEFGLLNYAISFIGIESINWVESSATSKWSVMMLVVWRWTGLTCIYFLAGLQFIDRTLYEAAKSWGVDPKAEMYKLPAMYVGAYAERDAQLTLELWQELKKEIIHQDIQSVFKMEMELFPCLVDMRFLGVRVNQEQAAKEKKTLVEQEKKMLGEVLVSTGIDVQIWAARSIAKVFDKLGLPYDKAFAVIPIFYFAASICTKRFSLNSLRGNYRVRGHRGGRYNPMGVHWWVHQ